MTRARAAPVQRVGSSRPGFLAAAAVVIVAAGSFGAVLGSVYGASTMLQLQRSNATQLLSRLADQDAAIELYARRVGEVRAAIDRWRELHSRVLRPFGPEARSARRTAGIGGARGTTPFDTADRLGADDHPGAGRPGNAADDLARLGEIVREQTESLRSLEGFLGRASTLMAALPSRWPLRGPINSEFGRRLSPWTLGPEFHGGLDIAAPIGTPVRAPAPGTVAFAGRHAEYGLHAIIDHGNDTVSLYGHLSRLDVQARQSVSRGQVIAWSGNTGRSSGPHLHYEIRVRGRAVNPHHYLWE